MVAAIPFFINNVGQEPLNIHDADLFENIKSVDDHYPNPIADLIIPLQ